MWACSTLPRPGRTCAFVLLAALIMAYLVIPNLAPTFSLRAAPPSLHSLSPPLRRHAPLRRHPSGRRRPTPAPPAKQQRTGKEREWRRPRKERDDIATMMYKVLGYDALPDQCRRNASLPDRTNPDLNLYREGPYQFLSDYRNPCWRQGPSRRFQCWPHVYLAGFPKCGTTDLFRRMTRHPEVVGTLLKEPKWLERGRFSGTSLTKYTSYVAMALREHAYDIRKAVVVDGSVSTLWDNHNWKQVPGNERCTEPRVVNPDLIQHLNPDAKIIVMLRNPTTRAQSDYLFRCHGCKDYDQHFFHEHVLRKIAEFKSCRKKASLRACVYREDVFERGRLRLGMYAVYLEDWFLRFPRDQMLFLRMEDDHGGRRSLETVFRFLGVDVPNNRTLEVMMDLPKANVRELNPGPMWNTTRALLDDLYRPYNARLAQILGDRRFTWEDV